MGVGKRIAKLGAMGLFCLAGEIWKSKGHPILYYHSVRTESDVISMSPGLFREEMLFFVKRGYQVASMRGFSERMGSGKDSGPERTVFLTFDDGLEGVYQHVFPVLQELGISATVFLVTGHMGGMADWYPMESGGVVPPLPMLHWEQIEEMNRYGVDFQAHTHTHPHLTAIPPKHCMEEALRSKTSIEEKLGTVVDLFCYPNGEYSREIASAIRECGFRAAVTSDLGMHRAGEDLFSIRRFGHDLVRVEDARMARLMARMLLNGAFRPYVLFKKGLRKSRIVDAPFQLTKHGSVIR